MLSDRTGRTERCRRHRSAGGAGGGPGPRPLRGWPIVVRLLLGLAPALLAPGCQAAGPGFVPPAAPFIATPEEVGIAMLRLAEVGPDDVVYDLGSGDGRLVLTAARLFGARGVGVEIDGPLVQSSRERALAEGVADRVRFLWQDLFVTDLSPATVVTLYLGEEVNLRLRSKLLAELRPGARVVSHDFTLGDWQPDRVVRVRGPERLHALYLWIVPGRAAGTWNGTARWRERDLSLHLELRQDYQRLAGTLVLGTQLHAVEGTLAGDRLVLTGSGLLLEGQVGSTLAGGTLRSSGGDIGTWTAARRP